MFPLAQDEVVGSWKRHPPRSSACLLSQCPLLLRALWLVHWSQSSRCSARCHLQKENSGCVYLLQTLQVSNETQLVCESEKRVRVLYDVVETPGWVGVCPSKLLFHCQTTASWLPLRTYQKPNRLLGFLLFNCYADNT